MLVDRRERITEKLDNMVFPPRYRFRNWLAAHLDNRSYRVKGEGQLTRELHLGGRKTPRHSARTAALQPRHEVGVVFLMISFSITLHLSFL